MSDMVVSVASRILLREEWPEGTGEDCAWIQAGQTMKRGTPNRYEHVAHQFFFVLFYVMVLVGQLTPFLLNQERKCKETSGSLHGEGDHKAPSTCGRDAKGDSVAAQQQGRTHERKRRLCALTQGIQTML